MSTIPRDLASRSNSARGLLCRDWISRDTDASCSEPLAASHREQAVLRGEQMAPLGHYSLEGSHHDLLCDKETVALCALAQANDRDDFFRLVAHVRHPIGQPGHLLAC